MCLSLGHHVLSHGDGFVSIGQLVGVEQVLRLVEHAVLLLGHVHRGVRAHV